jgi:hypothetical protein
MQKLDFILNLEVITNKLQSNAIVKQFQGGFGNPTQSFNYANINPLLFTSKSNYDQLKTDERYSSILTSLNAQAIYTESNLSDLTAVLRATQALHIIAKPNTIALYNFHNTLTNTLNLSKEILSNSIISEGHLASLDGGILLFQIIIETEGLETEKYIKIFTALQELINTIAKIHEDDKKPEIILLDSGSDTNLGVKTGIETAKSLFQIFKEVWDFIVNFKYYKQEQKSKALLDSLAIREVIKEKVDAGIITENEAKEYTHLIKTRTDDLIGMKVMPKEIINESNNIDNKKLLGEFEGLKLLK